MDLAVHRGFGKKLDLERRDCPGGSIAFPPAPRGHVTIAGLDFDDQLVASYTCLEEDFSLSLVTRMEHVLSRKAARRLRLVDTG